MKKTVLAAAAALTGLLSANAQKGNIGFIYPAGSCKGTTVEVSIGGQNLSKAEAIVFSGEGVKGELIPAPEGQKPRKKKGKKNIGEEDNLQLSDVVRFRVTVDRNAAPGMRDVRLKLPSGMSNRLYFEVGQLPDVCEEPAEKISAEAGSLPVTFNGQVTRSDVDRFRFPAKKGQQLVFRVKGRVFVPYMADAVPGWFQPIIRLYDPSGREVAFNDDYTFHVDPVLFFKVPETGCYDIEINDALYRGREDFVYRIDVGELPFISSISPLGGPAGQKQTVNLRGYNLKSRTLKMKNPEQGIIPVTAKGKGGILSNTLLYSADGYGQLHAAPDAALSKSTALSIEPGKVCERCFTAPLQQHWFTFRLSRRQKCHLSVLSRRLGAPSDVRMTIFAASGKAIADVDDTEDPGDYMATHFADPEITMDLKPGVYKVRLIESQGRSGEEYAYRFCLDKARPDFSITMEPASIGIPAGGTGVFNVLLDRKQNFRSEVDLEIEGLPEGFTVSGARIEKGKKKTIVSVTAPSGAAAEVIRPRVFGLASEGGQTVRREASAAESMMQAFYYIHMLPMEEFRMEVGTGQPFTMKIELPEGGDIPVLRRDRKVPLKVRIERKPGFDSPVTLMLRSSENFPKAEAVVIPAGESEGTLEMEVRSRAKTKTDVLAKVCVSGVVKGSSKKVAGQGRNSFSASVTAYAPVFTAVLKAE